MYYILLCNVSTITHIGSLLAHDIYLFGSVLLCVNVNICLHMCLQLEFYFLEAAIPQSYALLLGLCIFLRNSILSCFLVHADDQKEGKYLIHG